MQIQYEYKVNSCQCTVNSYAFSPLLFGTFWNFKKYFQPVAAWIHGCGTCRHGGRTVSKSLKVSTPDHFEVGVPSLQDSMVWPENEMRWYEMKYSQIMSLLCSKLPFALSKTAVYTVTLRDLAPHYLSLISSSASCSLLPLVWQVI